MLTKLCLTWSFPHTIRFSSTIWHGAEKATQVVVCLIIIKKFSSILQLLCLEMISFRKGKQPEAKENEKLEVLLNRANCSWNSWWKCFSTESLKKGGRGNGRREMFVPVKGSLTSSGRFLWTKLWWRPICILLNVIWNKNYGHVSS